MERMREHRALVGLDGLHANVLEIRPPMGFDASDAERLLEDLERSLSAT